MKSELPFYPVALTIAGSDSGGGAGIQADLRTFNASGVFGCSVITAVTAQNPTEVAAVQALDPAIVAAQYRAVTGKLHVAAAKSGMLANAAIVETLIPLLSQRDFPLVVDPVMISTSRRRLLEESALEILRDRYLGLADWITPNLPEAEWLLGTEIRTLADCFAAAEECSRKWDCGCILKTGHLEDGSDPLSRDAVAFQGELYELVSPKVEDLPPYAAHGTGCTLSSAIAAALAGGQNWKNALCEAKTFVYGSLVETAPIGPGIEAMYPPIESYRESVSLKKRKR